MSHFTLLVALLFVLFFVLSTIVRLFSGPRPVNQAKAVVEYAQKKGYALVNPAISQALGSSPLEMLKNPALRNSIRAAADVSDINGLDNGTGDWLAFTCSLRSHEVTIFNLSVTPRTVNSSSGNIHYKVAKISAVDLPRFSLGRNSGLHTLENVVGKLVGTPKPTVDLDARQYPEFAAHSWIRGSDAAAINAFLSPSKIKFLETAYLPGVLATNAKYLVYFEDGALRTAADFDSFISRAETVVANLL
jgi:hypothetical protein